MSYLPASRFPAILLGGPPHSGKSVLAQNLSKALAEADVQHYLLRAAPDGEGNWFHEAERTVAEKLRRKGKFTPAWVERVCHDIAGRPLPFLVDIGGRPEPWQEAIIDQCTHAILLTPDGQSLAEWQERIARYNLLTIASLTSQLTGESQLVEAGGPIIQGIISQLERGQPAAGPVFEAVLNRVTALFNYSYTELLNIHTEQAPVELVIDLPAMYRHLHLTRPGYNWQPADLPRVFDYLPQDTSLALYGRGPAWLYAAVANSIFPHPFYQFDARRGWIKPIRLSTSATAKVLVSVTVEPSESYLHLKLDLSEDYLIYLPELAAPLPTLPQTQGIILNGKLPNWLYTGLTLFYRSAPWVAIYYPPHNQAIVVATQDDVGQYRVGQSLPFTG
jgi:CRISPR-associated protein Csx3